MATPASMPPRKLISRNKRPMTSAAGMTNVAAMASQLSFVFSLSIFNGDAVFVEIIFFIPVSYELAEASSNVSICPFNWSPVKNPFHCWMISPLGLKKYVAGVPSTL